MDQLLEQIADIGENEIGDLLTAVLKRYGELFPEWEICTLSLLIAPDTPYSLVD